MVLQMMKIQTFLGKEEQVKYMDSLRKRKNKSKIWTLFRKEERVEDMDSPRKGRTSRRHKPSSDKGGAG